jgi:hypothetical protein
MCQTPLTNLAPISSILASQMFTLMMETSLGSLTAWFFRKALPSRALSLQTVVLVKMELN